MSYQIQRESTPMTVVGANGGEETDLATVNELCSD
jgi:hypothetical protein